jgi:glyoxylase-like metal-dependent hydrolase (beta-lactamase superfamily II)
MQKRVVKDSMIGLDMPAIDVWSERVTVILGQNPGPFTGPGTNTYLVGKGDRPLLLDTGQGIPEYLPLLEKAMTEVRPAGGLQEIILTHGHPDHVGGVDGVLEKFGSMSVAKKPWPGRDEGQQFVTLDDGDEIIAEAITLRAFWTPGHARDHLCFYMREEKALFTGDNVLGAGTTVIPPDGDLGDYLDSLRRVLQLDVEVIYPAHGPAIHNPREKIESYLAHRALRDEQIKAAMRDGVARIPDMVAQIYSDVPKYLHDAAAVSVHAHLRKMEREGIVDHDGDEWNLTE